MKFYVLVRKLGLPGQQYSIYRQQSRKKLISTMNEKDAHTLKLWPDKKKTKKDYKKFLGQCDPNAITFLCESALNIKNGNVPVNIKKIYPFEIQLKVLCKNKTSNNKRQKTLCSAKGIKLLQQISRPISLYFKCWCLNNSFWFQRRTISRNNQEVWRF